MEHTTTITCRALLASLLAISAAANAQDVREVKIATSSSSIGGGSARIAKELGLFEKHGIKAAVAPMETGSVATPALVSGAVDFVTSGPSDIVMAQSRGQKLVALTGAYHGSAATVVLSKAAAEKAHVAPTAPVADRLKALDGLTIASTSSGSTLTVTVKTAAESVGAKVNFVYMSQPAMVASFRRGLVQGFTVAAPYYIAPVNEGSGYVWLSGPRGDFPRQFAPVNSVVLIARREFAEANPDLVRRMVAVFADLSKAFDERPAAVKAAMAKLWPDLDAATLDMVIASEGRALKGAPVSVADMAQEVDYMKRGGVPLPNAEQLNPAAMVFP